MKSIFTTVNVRYDRWRKIVAYAYNKGIKTEDMMVHLIEKMVQVLLKERKFYSRAVKYQEPALEWKQPHISFTQCEYDRFFDVKKVYRLSISLILAMAVDYFDEEEIMQKDFDSYPKYSYKKRNFWNSATEIYIFSWIKQENNTKKPPE